MNLLLVKMKNAQAPFSGLYYLGEEAPTGEGIETLLKPVRCVEFLRQRQVPTRVVGAGGQPDAQSVLEPAFQDIPELVIEDEMIIPHESIMWSSPIGEESWLNKFYIDSLEEQNRVRKNMTQSAPPQPTLDQ